MSIMNEIVISITSYISDLNSHKISSKFVFIYDLLFAPSSFVGIPPFI